MSGTLFDPSGYTTGGAAKRSASRFGAGLIGRFLGTTIATGAGFAFGRAAGPILSPPLQALRNEVNSHYRFVPLSPQEAAEAEVRAGWSAAKVGNESAKSGASEDAVKALRAMAGSAPNVAQVLALWNREAMTEAEVERALTQNGIRAEWFDEVKALRYQLTDGATLARMAAQALIPEGEARELAARSGTSGAAFDRLYRAAFTAPDVAQLLELRNRGRIDDEEVLAGLRRHGYSEARAEDVATLRAYLLPPSDVIRLAVHEVYNPVQRAALDLDAEFPAEFRERARRLGISGEDAEDLWAGHWDLPSFEQASEMLFRGEITREQFDGLLAALDYAPTWRAKLAAIARRIPTLSDFIRFAQREVFDKQQRAALGLDSDYPDAFTAKAALHGLSEADARDYWAAHWRLPSALQGYRMLWRTDLGMDGLKGLLKALDYPEKWRERLIEIAYTELGRIDIRRALAAGHLTPDQAQERYERIGYRASDARLMVQLAKGTEASTSRDLTREDLTAEYEGLYIDRAAYLAGLDELGYSEAEAVALANLADAKRVKRARAQFESRIHAQFVGHKIDRPEAEAALTKTGTATAARERILSEWENEREVNVRRLTQAQVVKAFKKALMDRAAALDVLTDQGLSEAEANVLLDSAV